MDPLEKVEIGRTGLRVTRLGFGGAPLGNAYKVVPDDQAIATIHRTLELGTNYLDVAPLYGYGMAEERFGRALSGRLRDSFVISTKVGRLLRPGVPTDPNSIFKDTPPVGPVFDLSRDGILRSLEESLKRLKMERVEMLFIHDPDGYPDGPEEGYRKAMSETYPTLAELRSQGVVKAIGAGMNQWEMLARFARDGDFDCFLLAGRYTLIDFTALPELLPLCEEKGISISLGGAYNSGILASDLRETPRFKFDYRDAPPEIIEKAKRVKAVCDRHQVPLKAAALQFVLAHPAVPTVIPGASAPERVEENFRMVQHPIPNDLWSELRQEGLIPEEAPTPTA